MMSFLNRSAVLAAALIVAVASSASFGVTAYSIPAPVSGTQNFGGALGMDFDTTAPISISHLGVFDSNADGLAVPLKAYIYDRTSTAVPLATLNFAAGSTGTLVGSQRFLQLGSPLNLPAGFQGTIVAEGYGATELNGNSFGAGNFGGTVLNGAGALNFVGTSRFGGAGSFPGTPDGGPAARYGAGTFQFDLVHTGGPVTFQNPAAIFSQGGFPVSALIDGNVTPSVGGTGWANNAGGDNTAVLETTKNIIGDNHLTFEIVSGGFSVHTLGRFRLSVTGDDRATFADGLANGGDVTANWTVLDIISAKSSNAGTILTELGDGSIRASGGIAEVETYTLTSFFQGTITGVRLEAIEDPSFPANGPGRAANGNFVVLELRMSAIQIPEPASASLLLLGAAGLMRRRQRA